MFIRDYRLEDAEQMALIHNLHGQWFEEHEVGAEYVVNTGKRSDFKFFVADEQGRVVGFAGAIFYYKQGRAEVGPIAVLPDYLEHGVGSSLLSKILEFLKTKGVHRVISKVKTNNKNSLRFFIDHEFEPEGLLRRYTKTGEDVVQMVKFI